ncbi:HAMP domain-containing sensor histidine kinase [Chlorogloeopsis sp. ULAP01]|uniref:sensor histidine kinase n=1 Tax=Chlorogloeopsis sp. ULAP01 TaxID=3056483 RepID=UPI0025AAE03D|nr:HAMP domain-containing sensor histidine kinase [Chlorogloeopsis sp. ULAP01]MDM9385665.1 HAMP domain-containing sensor histidine kinase [Chlorogloeopsis sp. ULAP01]
MSADPFPQTSSCYLNSVTCWHHSELELSLLSRIDNAIEVSVMPAHLDAEIAPLAMDTIDLQIWIPSIVRLFKERICSQQKQLYIVTSAELPLLTTNISDLERILVELLTNACNYTPIGKAIIVCAYTTANTTQLSVSNSSVERDGTGLGLAIVQKLAQRLGASIFVESANEQITFTLQFPHKLTAKRGTNSRNSDGERIRFLTC